jgi:endoglucanase
MENMIKISFRNTVFISLLASVAFVPALTQDFKVQKNLMVDQFGYRPGDPKMAVISCPSIGFNSTDTFTPGPVIEVRRASDNQTVFSGKPELWNNGAVDFTSGDKGWWFDFSSVKDTGDLYIFDTEKKVRSYIFRISGDVYKNVLKAAIKVFYYQREGFPHDAKYAGNDWTDGPSFIGPGQDKECRYVYDKNNSKTARDLSGGWMDAGDCNKYITFAESPIHHLLTSFDQNPSAFTDDIGIPESGNGIPDIIDEVKFELDWIKKMQDVDGGVFIKMGNIDYKGITPLSLDKRPRYYGPKCSSSSISTAGMFAHAVIVLSRFPEFKNYVSDLKERAVKAWDWYQANAKCDTCDSGEIKSGDADKSILEQKEIEVLAAIYLFAITGQEKYNTVVKNKFAVTNSFYDRDFSMYFSYEMDALMYYVNLKKADLNVKEVTLGKREREGRVTDIYQYDPKSDLYGAYIPYSLYTWGSNNPRASVGSSNYDYIIYNIDPEHQLKYLKRSLGILHYFHGTNPFNMVYLTNMGKYGAECSLTEMFHSWFCGEKWRRNPPPAYITGGPNFYYDGAWKDLKLQPAQKTYKDSGAGYPEMSWELTEPAIYYQASYIKLLSKFVK